MVLMQERLYASIGIEKEELRTDDPPNSVAQSFSLSFPLPQNTLHSFLLVDPKEVEVEH